MVAIGQIMLLFIWSDHRGLIILIVMMMMSLVFATMVVSTVVIRSDDVALDTVERGLVLAVRMEVRVTHAVLKVECVALIVHKVTYMPALFDAPNAWCSGRIALILRPSSHSTAVSRIKARLP